MKRVLFFLAICLFVVLDNFGQKRASNWIFGHKAGHFLTFIDDTFIFEPLVNPAFGNGSSTCIACDFNGDILLYSDGKSVWNKHHSIILNGTGLSANSTNTHGCHILPWPGSDSLFLIITVNAIIASTNNLNYSIIDLSANSGNGAVIQKNISFFTPAVGMRVGAIYAENNRDIWLLAMEANKLNLLAFKITANGISSQPVETVFDSVLVSPAISASGRIAISRSGLVGLTIRGQGIFVCKFDRSTGQCKLMFVSRLSQFQNFWPFGIEFSYCENFLYVSSFVSNHLLQYELHHFPDSIGFTLQNIDSSQLGPCALLLANDHKIYGAYRDDTSIGRIMPPLQIGGQPIIETPLINCPSPFPGVLSIFSLSDIFHGYRFPCYETRTIDTALAEGQQIWIKGTWHSPPATVMDTTYTPSTGCDTLIEWRLSLLNHVTNTTAPESNISVYPNPAQGVLYVNHTNQNAAFRLYNKLGQVVIEQQNLPPGTAAVSLSGLAEGVYFWEYALPETGERVFGKTVKLSEP